MFRNPDTFLVPGFFYVLLFCWRGFWRVSDAHDPSPVRRALMDLGIVSPPDSDQAELPVVVKPILGVEDA